VPSHDGCHNAPRLREQEKTKPIASPQTRAWLHLATIVIDSGVALLIFRTAILRNRTVPVLVLTRDVGAASLLTADDLTTIALIPTQDAQVIFTCGQAKVLSTFTLNGLAKGAVLGDDDLTSQVLPTGLRSLGHSRRPRCAGLRVAASRLHAVRRRRRIVGLVRAWLAETGTPAARRGRRRRAGGPDVVTRNRRRQT